MSVVHLAYHKHLIKQLILFTVKKYRTVTSELKPKHAKSKNLIYLVWLYSRVFATNLNNLHDYKRKKTRHTSKSVYTGNGVNGHLKIQILVRFILISILMITQDHI